MLATYRKSRYGGPYGFWLNHTVGLSAEDSTMDHPHFTTHILLFYFMHGSGTMKIEGKTYPFEKGDIVLLSPSELFHCTVKDNTYHERVVLHIDASLVRSLPGDHSFLWEPFVNREKGVGNRIPSEIVKQYGWDTLLESVLRHEQAQDAVAEVLAYSGVLELLVKIGRYCLSHSAKQTDKPRENSLIDEVLAYLNENFVKDITIGTVAERFFINRSYLSHLFKEYVGMPLWTYVILRRLHSFNDLVENGCSVEDASRQVGFRNYSNFFRLYKKYRGMTPTEYKKQCRISAEK